MITVTEGKNVDIIEPFPIKEIQAAVGWMHCYKTLVCGDDGPQTNEEIGAFLLTNLQAPNIRTWAIVDKDNLTHTHSNAPLVGMISFERANAQNGYLHITTPRKVWGEKLAKPGMAEQATHLVISQLFTNEPALQRISVAIISTNKAAINLATRIGFKKEGYLPAMSKIKGLPADVVHYGLLRPIAVTVQEGS